MKRLSALVAMSAMAISLLAPSMVRANRNEVRYYPSGQTVRYYPSAQAGGCVSGVNTMSSVRYVPSGSVQYVPAGTRFVEPGMASSRVFFVSDNPRYDLSGADETVFLVDDGSSYRTNRGRTPVAYVTALGAYPTPQVVAVPSEYRQDWLAVAAGDRPVRCIPAAGTMATPTSYTMAPRAVTYTSTAPYHNNGYSYTTTTTTRYSGTQVRRAYRPRTHKVYRRTTYSNASRHYTVRRKTRATTASYYRPARTRVVTRTYAPAAEDCATMNTAAVAVAAQPMATNDLYQIGNTWYMESNGEWSRSDSWRGPFFRVKKGHVPREVRESAERSHSFESDDD
jgi:hypothetical protein